MNFRGVRVQVVNRKFCCRHCYTNEGRPCIQLAGSVIHRSRVSVSVIQIWQAYAYCANHRLCGVLEHGIVQAMDERYLDRERPNDRY